MYKDNYLPQDSWEEIDEENFDWFLNCLSSSAKLIIHSEKLKSLQFLRSTHNDNIYLILHHHLPPLRQDGERFLNSEPYTHLNTGEGVYLACKMENNRFYKRRMTIKQYDQQKFS
jgi:hypothetical protein